MMNKKINISNALSLFRLVISPVIMFFIIFDKMYPALILFILASLTDFLDGYFSRRLRIETKFGDMLDKISDKVLVGFVIIGFLIKFDALKLLFVLIPAIILYIVAYSYFIKYKQKTSLPGRINIPLQAIAIIAFLLDWKYKFYLFWIVIATTAYVGFSYIYAILKIYTKK